MLKCFVKSPNQEGKIMYELDTASRHYDAFKEEQLAITTHGKVRYALFSKLFVIETNTMYKMKNTFSMIVCCQFAGTQRSNVLCKWHS